MTEDKQAALRNILDIARRYDIGPQDIVAAFEGDLESRPAHSRGVMSRLFNYLGGTFVFAGLGILIGTNWDALDTTARIMITLGPGVAAYTLAVVAAGDRRYDKATTPLFLIAAALQPTGMLVAFSEFSTGGDWRYAILVTNGTLLLQQSLGVWRLQRTVLVFTSLLFGLGFAWVGLDLIGLDAKYAAVVVGISMLSLCTGLAGTRHRIVTPFWYFIGALAVLYGSFEILEHTPVEVLYLGVASGMVYMSTLVRSRSLLLVSTIAIIGYLGYFTREHFVDSTGWPLALIVFGLMMIFMGALAFKLDRRYIRA